MSLVVTKLSSNSQAFTNAAYIHPETWRDKYIMIGNHVLTVLPDTTLPYNAIGLNSHRRKALNVTIGDMLNPQKAPYPPPLATCVMVTITRATSDATLNPAKLIPNALATHVLSTNLPFVISVDNNTITFEITAVQPEHSLLAPSTLIDYNTTTRNVKLEGICKKLVLNFDHLHYKALGVGGIADKLEDLFRRVFASRIMDPAIIQKMGVKHVKGILLYGPPGTGKTALARSIANLLKSQEPKIVNGPEILNKYVGQSEENMRALFQDAEKDYAQNGDNANLHTIIFDEIDAICKKRGSQANASGVNDTIVNQLLTKMDGVKPLPNILVIGITNRKDLLDSALLRPGRFEVQLEIGLPDTHGRTEILQIHTNNLSENSFLDKSVHMEHLAQQTENYSGAELEGIVRAAASYAIERAVRSQSQSQDVTVTIYPADFTKALQAIRPAHGIPQSTFHALAPSSWDTRPEQAPLLQELYHYLQLPHPSKRIRSLLIYGPPRSGKTACVIHSILTNSQIKNVKYVCARDVIVLSNDTQKTTHLINTMEEAHRTPYSLIVLDEIERLIEYTQEGPRFNNSILQTLLVLIKAVPITLHHHVTILGCTSITDTSMLSSLGLYDAFEEQISTI